METGGVKGSAATSVDTSCQSSPACDLGHYPSSYYEVTTVALPKKDKGTQPLDHRLLAIFSSLYRIEAGARFDIIKPWLRSILHPAVMGAIGGTEALDIAWDAQAYIEKTLLNGVATALVSYDFEKFPTRLGIRSLETCSNMVVYLTSLLTSPSTCIPT